MNAPPPTLGLIAGQGRLPVIVADGMRQAGVRVCCVGLREQYDESLTEICDEFHTAGIAQIGRWIRILKRAGVHEAVMVGRVAKLRMHDPLRLVRQVPDWRAARIWYRRLRGDRRNAALLAAVADELQHNGVTLIDSTTYIPDHLAAAGVMNTVALTAQHTADLEFGWPLLRQLVELDIGQAIAVRDRDVLAVEAVEGTDRMVDRAGELCRAKGWSLLKTSSTAHDRRADVPSIGVETVRRVAAAGGTCIGLGAGHVILIDKPAVLDAADHAGIAIVGVESSPTSGAR